MGVVAGVFGALSLPGRCWKRRDTRMIVIGDLVLETLPPGPPPVASYIEAVGMGPEYFVGGGGRCFRSVGFWGGRAGSCTPWMIYVGFFPLGG